MARMLVRYRVKPEAVAEVKKAIVEFVDAIREREPDTIYGAFLEEDGRSFFHLMIFPDREREESHRTSAHTEKFVAALYRNCEVEPEFRTLELVRSTKPGRGFLGMGQ